MTRSWRQLVALASVRALGLCVALLIRPAALSACSVCFQRDAGSTTTGIVAAVITLMAVTAGVFTGFAVFFVRFIRRTSGLP